MTPPRTPADRPAVATDAAGPALRVRDAPVPVRARAAALLVSLVVAGLAVLAGPRPPQLGDDATGDPALAARLRSAVGDAPVQGLAAVTGTGATATARAAVGRADARPGHERALTSDTPQEIGSVTKSLTGLLLADAVARGEVTPATTLGQVHPGAGLPPEVAALTLDQLATHTSGLPSLTGTRLVRGLLSGATHGNPYAGQTPDGTLAEAAGTRLRRDPGEHRYSNLGASVLGHALAARAGTAYPDLLRTRVLDPLGMTGTVAAPAEPPAGAAHETAANGAAAAPWTSAGGAPAGTGVWSSADDLGRLLAAVAGGTAPGPAATQPRVDAGQEGLRTGWGWLTYERDGRTLLLFNGQTGGGVSSIALDTASRDWAAVTAPSTAHTQTVALGLLGVTMSQPVADRSWLAPPVLVTAVLLVPLVSVLTRLRHRPRSPGAPAPDRLRAVGEVAWLAVVVVVARGLGAWQVVPAWTWPVSAGLAALAAALLLARWRSLPWPERHRAWRWLSTGVEAVVAGAVVAAVLTSTS